MTTSHGNDDQRQFEEGTQRVPTLRSCLLLFHAGAPVSYVRWQGEEGEIERFHLRLQKDTTNVPLLEHLAIVWSYQENKVEDPYQLREYATSAICCVDGQGRVARERAEIFEIFPIFNLERFRQFVRTQPQSVRFRTEPNAQAHPLCCYVRECFDQAILLSTSGTGYLLDMPDADEVLPLPFWAQLFQRILGTIVYDNLTDEETINWQDTVLNILDIVELLVSQYGELRNLIPV